MLSIILLGVLVTPFAFLTSVLAVRAVQRLALRRRILDIPNTRSSHTQPTPRGGGLAIVIVTLLGLLVYWGASSMSVSLPLLGYVLGASAIAIVSWLDDLHSLPNRVRFAVHFAAAIIGVVTVGYWHEMTLPLIGTVYLGWLGLPLALVWIIGFTNAYNFMDGIDGIAGSQAVVGGVGWSLLGWLSGQPMVTVLGLLVASSSLGFLVFNWSPASIFMGDVGSAFLGYTFAVLPLMSGCGRLPWGGAALSGVLLTWPFLADTAFTFMRRLVNGENVFQAHRSHIYQRLVIAGHSHQAVTLLYAGLSCVGVIAAVALRLQNP